MTIPEQISEVILLEVERQDVSREEKRRILMDYGHMLRRILPTLEQMDESKVTAFEHTS